MRPASTASSKRSSILRCSGEFLNSLQALAQRLSLLGALNSLSQITLKTMMPGVPDFYQGTELWDFSLVDPDNRRPVDFRRTRRPPDGAGDHGLGSLWSRSGRAVI